MRASTASLALGFVVIAPAFALGCGRSAAEASDGGGDGSAAVVATTITVDRALSLSTVPPGMVGLGYEKARLTDGLFNGGNTALVGMFRLLGPSIMRIGANSCDAMTWQAAAPADAGPAQVVTPGQIDALAAFMKASGWRVIYDLNMKTATSSSAAAEEAAYAVTAFGDSLYGLEIGNEPDVYPGTPVSPTWSYAAFKGEWESFASAIRAVARNAPLTGPADAYHVPDWTVPFASDEAPRLLLLTQHYYRGDGRAPTATLDLLLQPDPALPPMLQQLHDAAQASSIAGGYRLTETNSFYNFGTPGVSNTLGSALWVIDFLFANARYGSSGVNIEAGGDTPGYTPIADAGGTVVEARPIYYGMLLFTRVGAGTMLDVHAQLAGSANVTAYAVRSVDRSSLAVVIVNKEAATRAHATIDFGGQVTAANVVRLEGPAIDATSGVTLGGAAVDPTGAWTPNAPDPLPLVGTTTTLDVPPASAALVRATTP